MSINYYCYYLNKIEKILPVDVLIWQIDFLWEVKMKLGLNVSIDIEIYLLLNKIKYYISSLLFNVNGCVSCHKKSISFFV